MKATRVVKLLKNRLYPTFQLYAEMENRKTVPQDGLRLGALVVTDWLRQRLGEYTPEGTAQEAEVYRLSVVRRLILHPDFGLRQITPLRHEGNRRLSSTEAGSAGGAPWDRVLGGTALLGAVIAAS